MFQIIKDVESNKEQKKLNKEDQTAMDRIKSQ